MIKKQRKGNKKYMRIKLLNCKLHKNEYLNLKFNHKDTLNYFLLTFRQFICKSKYSLLIILLPRVLK